MVKIAPGEAKEVTFPVSLNLEKYSKLKRELIKNKTSASSQIDVKGWLSVEPVNL